MQNNPLPRTLVVSIHDVSPQTRARTQAILDDLAHAGCPCVSLLVIPDHHHRGRIDEVPGFANWIVAQQVHGHETVLHGFFHQREKTGRESLRMRLVTEHYTAGEGEFLDLGREVALERLRRGIRAFEHCGLGIPSGFIAPAWLLGVEAQEAVKMAGFRYTTRIGEVIDLQRNQEYRSRSLVWSVRAGWRRLASLAWNRSLLALALRESLLRIGIHPPDWDHAAIRSQILGSVRAALAGRRAMTYDGWTARWRAAS